MGNPCNFISIISHILFGFLAGFMTGFFGWFGLAIAIFIYIQFLLYEYFEETKIKDEMYYELREFAIGFSVGLIIGLVLSCIL